MKMTSVVTGAMYLLLLLQIILLLLPSPPAAALGVAPDVKPTAVTSYPQAADSGKPSEPTDAKPQRAVRTKR